jgi:hypothetical protein
MFTVTEQLRKTLIEGVEGEGWDEGYKHELAEELRALPAGPYDDSNDWDEDEDGYLEDSLCSLIDYFGVWHLTREVG